MVSNLLYLYNENPDNFDEIQIILTNGKMIYKNNEMKVNFIFNNIGLNTQILLELTPSTEKEIIKNTDKQVTLQTTKEITKETYKQVVVEATKEIIIKAGKEVVMQSNKELQKTY